MWHSDLLDDHNPHLAAAGEATLTQLTAGVHATQVEGWSPGAHLRTVA